MFQSDYKSKELSIKHITILILFIISSLYVSCSKKESFTEIIQNIDNIACTDIRIELYKYDERDTFFCFGYPTIYPNEIIENSTAHLIISGSEAFSALMVIKYLGEKSIYLVTNENIVSKPANYRFNYLYKLYSNNRLLYEFCYEDFPLWPPRENPPDYKIVWVNGKYHKVKDIIFFELLTSMYNKNYSFFNICE